MLSIEKIKAIVFPNEETQAAFVASAVTYEISGETFDDKLFQLLHSRNDRAVQLIFAPFLRALAIDLLKHGQSEFIQQVRAACIADWAMTHDGERWDDFLTLQAHDKTHATTHELFALADVFDITVYCTSITDDVVSKRGLIHAGGEDAIHLYCSDNEHWYVIENGYYHTLPDGNCLYNGFAQWLRLLMLQKTPEKIELVQPQIDDLPTVIVNQQLILSTTVPRDESPQPLTLSSADAVDVDHILAMQAVFASTASIHALRKEFALMADRDPDEMVLNFIKAKARLIKQLITPMNKREFVNQFKPILEDFLDYTDQLTVTTHRRQLEHLKNFLYYINNTLYIPGAKDVSVTWTVKDYQENVSHLQSLAQQMVDCKLPKLQKIGYAMLSIKFPYHALPSPTHHQSNPAQKSTPKLPHQDFLMAGILIMLAVIIALCCLILASLLTTTGAIVLGTAVKAGGIISGIGLCGYTLFQHCIPQDDNPCIALQNRLSNYVNC